MSTRALAVAAVAVLTASLYAVGARADEAQAADLIVMQDGSRILGTVTAARDGKLTVKTAFAGTLTIQLEQVESVNSVSPVTLLLADETVVEDEPLRIEQGQLVTAAEPEAKYPLSDLAVLNPQPWEMGRGYGWTGLIDFALVMQRGNTDTDELDYQLESTWESTRDRYRLLARGEQDEANGETTAESWLVRGRWNYFLEDPNYWGFLVQAEKDKFADLDLRWLAGPFVGRQFLSAPIFTLAGEFGFSYVTEEFNVAEDEDSGAANWDLDITSDFLGGDSQLYLRQFGLWTLDDTSEVIIDTTLGLSFPLLFDFRAAAEILWEYDTGAVDNVNELDQTYRLRIGYTW